MKVVDDIILMAAKLFLDGQLDGLHVTTTRRPIGGYHVSSMGVVVVFAHDAIQALRWHRQLDGVGGAELRRHMRREAHELGPVREPNDDEFLENEKRLSYWSLKLRGYCVSALGKEAK